LNLNRISWPITGNLIEPIKTIRDTTDRDNCGLGAVSLVAVLSVYRYHNGSQVGFDLRFILKHHRWIAIADLAVPVWQSVYELRLILLSIFE